MARKKNSTSKADAKDKDGKPSKDVEATAEESSSEDAGTDATSPDISAEDTHSEPEAVAQDAVIVEEDSVTEMEDVTGSEDEAGISSDTDGEEPVVEDPPVAEEKPSYVVPTTTQTVVERKGGFVPMLLGGVAAGAIGFGAAYGLMSQPRDDGASAIGDALTAQMNDANSEIADLKDAVAQIPAAPDLSGLEADLSNLTASLDAVVDRLGVVESQVSGIDERLTAVEKRPITEGASDAAVAAYERELKALQDAMAAQRAEIETVAAEAQALESSAEETARTTMLRSALTRIQTALDSGSGFAPAVGDLQAAGIDVPAGLAEIAEDGAPSLAQLQAGFPDAARSALAAARKGAASSGEESGFSAFLKNQLGTRSLEPREGDDPDAVLSRAEAAVREGRLGDALAEIEALPEVGRTALADWTLEVDRRQAALSAVEALGQELN